MSTTREWAHGFAERMEHKLSLNRHKGDREGWLRDSPEALLARVKQEVQELEDAIAAGAPPSEVWAEAADVGNMAGMVADSYEVRRKPAP